MNTPKIRFKGFTDDWEQRKLGDVIEKLTGGASIAPDDYVDVGYRTIPKGAVNSSGVADMSGCKNVSQNFFKKNISSKTSSGELVTSLRDLVPTAPNMGRIVRICGETEDFLMPQGVYSIIVNEKISEDFLITYSNSPEYRKIIMAEKNGSTQVHIRNGEFLNIDIPLPSHEEQGKIGEYFKTLDHLITLHQRKCDETKQLKKFMLQKMFPKNGEKNPKIRFEGFTDDWEQRKFSELVTIERGGSPRPIDRFITKEENGLNWIKIGDAPEQGNYITKTEEKIKPEGLSKTREVHPGDLILSNSMSFGRPYILAIDGCIHDGWLAIRDTEKRFDLKFLCTLLGTDNMLSQYKAMAAGSTVNNLNKELVGATTVSYPVMDEQVKLGEFFDGIDHLITLHQRKCEKLKALKKFMLQNMFI